MGLRRRRDEALEPVVDEATTEQEPVPFWKKEAAQPPVRDSGPGEGARGNRQVPPPTDELPFWKRDISFKKKPKAEAAEPVVDVPPVDDEPAEPKPSIWKRELSLGRRKAAQLPVRDSGPGEGARGNREVCPATDEAAEKSVPFWKREISLGRKRREAEPEAEAVDAADEEESWNRDLIFGAVETQPEVAPEAEPEPLPEPVFFELPAEADAVADEEPEPEVDDEREPPIVSHRAWDSSAISPSVSSAYGWVTDDLEPADLASTSWAGTGPPIPIVPEAQPPVRDSGPGEGARGNREVPPLHENQPEREPVAVEATAEELAEEPEIEPVPEPVVVHPPVTAEELPPIPEADEEKKPSRLSFRRKKAEREDPEAELTAEEPQEEKKSPLKREISFKRRRKDKSPDAEPLAEEAEPKQDTEPKERRRAKNGHGGRHKKVVGLKIGASQLAAARVHNNGAAHLVQLARQELDAGVVVGGELRDPDALAQALKEFFKKHKLPKTGVRLGIANNRIGVRTFDLGGIDDPKQLANAIRFRAQEALPIPIEEAVLDYRVLGETVDEEGGVARRILLVVAYRDLVDRYVDACRKAGIKLVGIDLEAFALLRALSAPPEDDEHEAEAATTAVAIGHERSTFAVSDGRVCEFTRVLEWGGSSLDVAIARALDLAPSEAEPIKRALSLAAETDVDGLDADQVAQAREAVLRQVQSFARELVSSLQFYQGQPGSLGIAEITITGGTAHLPGLAAELERLIGVRVRVADPLGRVRVGKKVADEEQIGSLAVAIGLGIED